MKNLNRIRSYVRRQGRMSPAQKTAMAENWAVYGLSTEQGMLDYQRLFSGKAPLTLEIGFGMGSSLLTQAAQHPDHHYIGIEVHRPGVGAFLSGAKQAGLNNVRVFSEDAIDVLEQSIPDASLDCINLFFPDPWPKKRHHKRRLVQSELMQLLGKKTKPGGYFHVATDWANYAEHIQEVMAQDKQWSYLPEIPAEATDLLERPQTKYEKRGLALGHQVWDGVFQWLGGAKVENGVISPKISIFGLDFASARLN